MTSLPSTHILAHFYMHAHARGKPKRTYCCPRAPTRARTQTEAKKTQTDRQTEHTQADNRRKNPSKSTNMKQSAEADRYEGASAAAAQSRDGPVTDTLRRHRCTERTHEGRESPPCSVGARHARGTHTCGFSLSTDRTS